MVGKKEKGGTKGKDELRRFAGILLTARNGDLNTRYEVEFVYGIVRLDIVAVIIDAQLTGPGGASRIRLAQFINDQVGIGGDSNLPVVPVLGQPSLSLGLKRKFYPAGGSLDLSMDSMRMIPGKAKGVEMAVRVVLIDENDKVRQRFKLEPTEEMLLHPNTGAHWTFNLDKAKPGLAYTLKASLNLGGVIGTIEKSLEFVGPEELDQERVQSSAYSATSSRTPSGSLK